MKAKIDVLEESIKEKFSEYLYASGAGTDPQGLGFSFLMIQLLVLLVISIVLLKVSVAY
jgi:hypothetical protein